MSAKTLVYNNLLLGQLVGQVGIYTQKGAAAVGHSCWLVNKHGCDQ